MASKKKKQNAKRIGKIMKGIGLIILVIVIVKWALKKYQSKKVPPHPPPEYKIETKPADYVATERIRSSVTDEIIAKWAPEITFHFLERFYPLSAESLLIGADRYEVSGSGPTEKVISEYISISKTSDIAGLGSSWYVCFFFFFFFSFFFPFSFPFIDVFICFIVIFFFFALHYINRRLRLDPDKSSNGSGEITNNNITAPMYVGIRVAEDQSYVELAYRFLFGFNGPQSLHVKLSDFNYTLPELAEHDGDWEGCQIRLTPDLKYCLGVITEAHGNVKEYLPQECFWLDQTHVILRSAVNSHGIYNAYGTTNIVLESFGVLEVIDAITDRGAKWQP